MSSFKSINPYTEEAFGSYSCLGKEEILLVLKQMNTAQYKWKQKSVKERIAFLPQLSALLKEHADDLAQTATLEMGKLFTHARAEVLKSASLCDYYYAQAEQLLQSETKQLDNGTSVEIKFDPIGIVLGIFPWNFPYWQIIRSAIPSIVSGNAMLVKPAPNVPQCSLALQRIIDNSGLNPFLFQTCFLLENQIPTLIEDERIKAVTLTGSEKAGSIVSSMAAKHIKPSVLELGGSDALIILEDACLEDIIDQVVFSRFQNNGQSCVAAKRFLVQDSLLEPFKKLLVEKVKAYVNGNPMEQATHIGPLARKDLRDHLAEQVLASINVGAQILYQATDIPAKGWYYPPTILENIPKNCPAYQEELFGPVLSLFTFKTKEEAIALANDTRYGLGASIFTKDIESAKEMATKIEAGMVYINQMVKSEVGIPFGGSKHSGFGRELGADGLYAFCQRKAIWGGK